MEEIKMTNTTMTAVNPQVNEPSDTPVNALVSAAQQATGNSPTPVNQTLPSSAILTAPVGLFSKIQQLNQAKSQTQFQAQIGKSYYIPAVSPGTYFAVVTDGVFDENATTKNGKQALLILTWTVYVPQHNQPEQEVELKQYYYKTPNQKAPYVWLLSKLLGYDSKQGFSIGDLLGVVCTIEVKHDQKDNGNVYAEIAQLEKIQLDDSPATVSF
ncbi:hypothetical protein [Sporosarcina sp. FA9]|uniref:hypothetical protein n=1 Tax=Sporosarcina sp. FA9 TaxID=3413030 RepID=UPI003F65EDB0